MDQDTSNSPGKARWRERLGMGSPGKELPKISDEFKSTSQPARSASSPPKEAEVPQGVNRGHQPVTKPAPMAPRTPPRPGAPAETGTRSVSAIPQGASGLGDRLRAERQAAEKLAEQRVAQARSGPDRPPQHRSPQPTSNQRLTPPASERAPERPKFSFSPEELAKDKREQGPSPEREFPSFTSKPNLSATPPPPLTPPRPALGGNAQAQKQPRPQPPKPPANNAPAASPPGFQSRFSGPPQPPGGNYRSLDPPPGGVGPKSKPYADTAAFRDDPLARRPANREYDAYRRGPALPAYGDDNDSPSLGDYRRSRPPVPARGRRPAYDEDVNEVFEDEEPPRPQRRRASAQDYNRAYRDYEDGYDAEPPRRRGPWLWLLAIAAIGVLAAGVIYYYLTYMKTSGQANGDVPVIEAPQQAPKSAPEPSSGSTLGTQGSAQSNPADQRKQIYDRILGDDEAGNQVVPTQEQPKTVEPTGDNANTGQGGAPDPTRGADDNASDPMPLPLPPPGDQGSLPGNANQQTAALGAVNKSATHQPAPEFVSNDVAWPALNDSADTGAPVPGQVAKSTDPNAAQPPPQAEQISEPDPLPVQPVKPKVRAEKKPAKKPVAAVEGTGAGQNDGVAPLVLVPPAQTGTTQATTQAQDIQNNPPVALPDVDRQPKAETAATEQKSTSFFGVGSNKLRLTGKGAEGAIQGGTGNWVNSPTQSAASAQPADVGPEQVPQQVPQATPQQVPQATPQQIVSVAPETVAAPQPVQPAPAQTTPSGSGFIAQLASFRSESEAMAEYDRIRSKHSDVLSGLSPRIVKATVAGASRYRLAVGPLASRSAASKLCTSLIAAGERDCLVRGN